MTSTQQETAAGDQGRTPVSTDLFPTADAATAYITRHDAGVKQLCRMKMPELREEWQAELRSRHIISISGGPGNKDELIRAILEYRYPHIKEANEVFVTEHSRRAHADFILDMTMRLVNISDDDLGEVLRASHPEVRRRLRHALDAMR